VFVTNVNVDISKRFLWSNDSTSSTKSVRLWESFRTSSVKRELAVYKFVSLVKDSVIYKQV
jgi:hypothetical protein